jgi:hypothetical protein
MTGPGSIPGKLEIRKEIGFAVAEPTQRTYAGLSAESGIKRIRLDNQPTDPAAAGRNVCDSATGHNYSELGESYEHRI